MTLPEITPTTTMQEVEDNYPSARRALFMRYHVGGCSTCAYQPTDSIQKMCGDHNILDVNEVIQAIQASQEADALITIEPEEAAKLMGFDEGWEMFDMRGDDERARASIEGATDLTDELHAKMIEGDRSKKLIFFCHDGAKSLDAASFYRGHNFEHAKSIAGGIDAWSQKVDPSVPRY